MNSNEIKIRLLAHLAMDGTANDNTTDELYRAAHRIHAEVETDLEAVEGWAWVVVNSAGKRRSVPVDSMRAQAENAFADE